MESVSPAAVKGAALVIYIRRRRLRANAGRQSRRHRRADTGRTEEQTRARIEEARSAAQKFVAAADEWCDVVSVFEQVVVGHAALIGQRAGRRIPYRSRVLKDLAHARIGRKGFSLFDADRGEQA